MIQPIKKQEVPPELLSVLLSLAWAVIPLPGRNSQIRFWWPPKGTTDAAGKHIGQYRAVSTGQRSEKISKEKEKELVSAWFIKNGFKPAATHAPENDFLLVDEVAAYIEKEYRGAPHGTIKPIRQHLDRLVAFLIAGEPARKIEGVSTLRQVTRRHFDAAWAKMELAEVQEPGKPPVYLVGKTKKNMLGNLRKFFRWELRREVREGVTYIEKDPTLNAVMPSKGECLAPVKEKWEADEFKKTIKFMRCADSRDTLLMLRYCGGLDVADTMQLQALHFKRTPKGVLFIEKLRAKSKRSSRNEWIKIPVAAVILPMVEARLAACKAPEDFIFPWNSRHSNIDGFESSLYKRTKKARERAGLPMKEIKALRHTFATEQIAKGVSIPQVGAWLGHVKGSPVTAAVYNLHEGEAELIN